MWSTGCKHDVERKRTQAVEDTGGVVDMRLIDADALKEYFKKCLRVENGKDDTKERYAYMAWLRGVHAIDDAPTVERHGKWLPGKQMYYYMPNDGQEYPAGVIGVYVCSVCEEDVKKETNYCPNCGAKMQGEE